MTLIFCGVGLGASDDSDMSGAELRLGGSRVGEWRMSSDALTPS